MRITRYTLLPLHRFPAAKFQKLLRSAKAKAQKSRLPKLCACR